MSDRPFLSAALGSTARIAGAAGLTTSQPIKVIDVSERPAVANVIRDGKQVPAVGVSQIDLQNWLNIGVIGPIEDRRRVVTQSVPPGTRVARNASVDIVLAEPVIIPIGVLQQPHRSLVNANFTVQGVLTEFPRRSPESATRCSTPTGQTSTRRRRSSVSETNSTPTTRRSMTATRRATSAPRFGR